MLGIIIALLIVIIVILSVGFYSYVKNNTSKNENNSESILDQNNIDEPYMLDGPGSEIDINGNLVQEQVLSTYNDNLRLNEYIDFTDNECIAIGYVTDLNETQFIDKYFPDGSYGSLAYHDFRYPDNRVDGYGNKFVVIPMNENVKITVYDCYIDEEDGELYTDNTLISEATEPFIILDDYIEYTPTMCIKFEYNGFEEMFPINFSGEDGTLDLKGYEMEVKDISLY